MYIEKINSPKDIKELNANQLKQLSQEIREFLIDNVCKTGGHLASNLGVVELTLTLHKVFDSPKDKIIWDVGHQSYIHKIITGRKSQFNTLRKFGGLSGFPKVCESEHDIYNTGHSSTSISAALGIAKARDIKGEDFSVVAVIGDGALTGGMAFEALNDAGHSKNNLIIILNDNEMSIAKNVGALSKYLSTIRTQPIYNKAKKDFDSLITNIPAIGESMAKLVEKAKGSIKHFIIPGAIFEDLGLTYVGPVDGHDISELEKVLSCVKKIDGPILVHILTKKGKGFKYAEEKPDKFHGISAFDKVTGQSEKNDQLDFSGVFGKAVVELAKKDNSITAITAAMSAGTGLVEFSKKYPQRFFDVGIAEQHSVTFASGLASQGLKPIVAVYSTFLQRAYDQILHDVALQKLPVVFAVDRAGVVGADGETHHGVFDLSFLGHIPNMTIMAPRSYYELEQMLCLAVCSKAGPTAVRYPRGFEVPIYDIANTPVEFGKAEVLLEGSEMLIVGVGKMAVTAYNVAKRLNSIGISAGAANARFIKPLDQELIKECVESNKMLVIIEDNIRLGGFGAHVLNYLNENDLNSSGLKIFAYPDEFITHGKVEELHKKYGLDEENIFNAIYSMVAINV